ncbi:MAG: transmembrane Mn(2+) transporter, partial [Planctomycetales bacterium]
LGGIVGGVGQALAISLPMTSQGMLYNKMADARIRLHEAESTLGTLETARQQLKEARADQGIAKNDAAARIARLESEIARLEPDVPKMQERLVELPRKIADDKTIYDAAYKPTLDADGKEVEAKPYDQYYWAGVVSVITSVVLIFGKYGLIQSFSMAMVASFTVVTIVNVYVLQTFPRWAASGEEIMRGLSFGLPEAVGAGGDQWAAVGTALAAFGIIGVGASELIAYPYWCLEKGYARYTGPRDDSEEWAQRARGWMRVMRVDAWCSMVVYTLATVAFYLLGAAVLARKGLNPEGTEMIRMLGEMYAPVFGEWARVLFLFGSFAVLYSTFFVANAGHARVFSDALRVFGLLPDNPTARKWSLTILSGVLPMLCLLAYCVFQSPT